MFAEIRSRYGTNFANYKVLTRWRSLTFDTKRNDVGAGSLDILASEYANGGADAAGTPISDLSVLEIAPNGLSSLPNTWYVTAGLSGTSVIDDAPFNKVSIAGLISWLAEAVVYPSAYPTTTPFNFSFLNATPGFIMRTLITRAQTDRGELPWLLVDFTGTTTSSGAAWATTISKTYDVGTSLLDVVRDLQTLGLLTYRMSGRTLQLFNPDENVTFWTPNQVMLRRGQLITEQSLNTDPTALRTHMLVIGDSGVVVEVSDATALALVGRRRTATMTASGITDIPTLQLVGQKALAQINHVSSEETFGLRDAVVAADGTRTVQPWVNYQVGDWVWRDVDGVPKNVQIQTIGAAAADAESELAISVAVGDLLDDQDAKIAKLLAAILGGTTGGIPNDNPVDYTFPNPVGGVTTLPTAYRDAAGNGFARATVSWVAPTLNTDGTALTDYAGADVSYQVLTTDPATPSTNKALGLGQLGRLVNWCANPSLEVNTGGYAVSGTGVTFARLTTGGTRGAACGQAVSDGSIASQGFSYGVGLPAAAGRPNNLVVSCDLQGNAGGEVVSVWGVVVYSDSTNTAGAPTVATLTTGWQRFSATLAIPANGKTVSAVYLFVRTATAHAYTWRIDGVRLIDDTSADGTVYYDGSMTGYVWSGSPDASTTVTPGSVYPDVGWRPGSGRSDPSIVTDGSFASTYYGETATSSGLTRALIMDLGQPMIVSGMNIKHWTIVTYSRVLLEGSLDGLTWFTLFDTNSAGTYAEVNSTSTGRVFTFPAFAARYLRDSLTTGASANVALWAEWQVFAQTAAELTTPWTANARTPKNATAAFLSGLTSGGLFIPRVSAVDNSNHAGAWAYGPAVRLPTMGDTPATPSTPTITAGLAITRVAWNGLTSTGAAYGTDLSYVEVHRSTTTNFTPSSATLYDTLTAAGTSVSSTPYGTTYYYKLRAVNRQGTPSAASAQASGSTTQIVGGDILDGAVGTLKLADLAVTTAKIGLLAVNDAQIGSLSVGKLTAGTISSDVVVGSRIKTADTGARAEMNSTGFQAFDSSGNNTVWIKGSDGSALITGQYRSGLTGHRVEMGGAASGASYTITLYTGTLNSSGSLVENRSVVQQFQKVNVDPLSGSSTTTERFSIDMNGNETDSYGGWIHNYQSGTYSGGGPQYSTDIMSLSNLFLRARSGQVNLYAETGSIYVRATGPTSSALIRAQTTGNYGDTGSDSGVVVSPGTVQLITAVLTTGTPGSPRTYLDAHPTYANWYFGGVGTDNDSFAFYPDNDNYTNARLIMKAPRATGNSPTLNMVNSGGYAVGLRMLRDGTGAVYAEVVDVTSTAYAPIKASAFNVSSARSTKTDIQPLSTDLAAQRILTAPVRTYRRRAPRPLVSLLRGGPDTLHADPPPTEHVGLVADEVDPALVSGEGASAGVELYDLAAHLVGAVQHLNRRIKALEEK